MLRCGKIRVVTVVKVTLVLAIICGIILGLTVWDLDKRIGNLFKWVDDHRVPGTFIFMAIYIALTGTFPVQLKVPVQPGKATGSQKWSLQQALKY
jgi:uncharacterized membrane protein YdjX (TVP38/TMEM64 family)